VKFVFAPFGSKPNYDTAAAIGCDGLPPARLCLSHWPGNTTPPDLARDLSTGIALAFARLPAAEREARFGKLAFVVNDHFDTDGLLAIFTCLQPRAALERSEALLSAARAGDYWCAPTPRSLAFDAAVSLYDDPKRSPIRAELAGRTEAERRAIAYAALLERLPGAIDDPASLGAEIDGEVARVEEDLAHLREAGVVTRVPAKNLAILRPARAVDPRAAHEAADCDRVLVLREGDGGAYAELTLSARSWFDLPARRELPRPDLLALARELRERERGEGEWRASRSDEPFATLAFAGPAQRGGVRATDPELRPSSIPTKEIFEYVLRSL
jgi:uncharacterized protein DUF6687